MNKIEILDLSKLYQNSFRNITKPHGLELYQILWFKKGVSKHWVDFNSLEIEDNTLLFLTKNSLQKFDEKGYPKGKLILFSDEFFAESLTDNKYLKRSILFNDLHSVAKFKLEKESLNLQKIFNQIAQELEQPEDNYQITILRNLLKNFLLYSERERKNSNNFKEIKKDKSLDLVMQFKALLATNFIAHKDVLFYCKTMQVTPKKLNSATTKTLQLSPKSIIINHTLLEAKKQLASTLQNTKEISLSLGFEEPTNFIKFFKKQVGKTPLAFRDSFNLE